MTCPEETELVVVGGEKRHSLMGIIWDHGEPVGASIFWVSQHEMKKSVCKIGVFHFFHSKNARLNMHLMIAIWAHIHGWFFGRLSGHYAVPRSAGCQCVVLGWERIHEWKSLGFVRIQRGCQQQYLLLGYSWVTYVDITNYNAVHVCK